MWKIILVSLVSFGFSACTNLVLKEDNGEHLKRFKEKYPYTLIGEDYQLLNEDDLAIRSLVAKGEPFSLTKSTSHAYWQCFSLKNSNFECDESSSDPMENGAAGALIAIVLKKEGITHEYLSRRGISLELCNKHQQKWLSLTKGQEHVCVSGEFINPLKENLNKPERAWIFVSFKTHLGCDSYFDGDCSLADRLNPASVPSKH